jgi:hypothetical protein
MTGRHVSAALLLLLCVSVCGFSQVVNATLSGTVSDTTGALIPGVEITATQTGTGVVATVVTNESGTFRFASLQPGPYRVAAALPGFQTQTFQLELGTAQQIRQNFTLQVGNVAQAVEVSVAADQLLTAQSSSVGNALGQSQVVDVPLVGRNVLDLATRIMPGVRGDGQANTTFAGIPANGGGNISMQMDGVTMNTGKHTQGLKTATFVNPDMVDEVRVIVAAVDVEGRASAQIQMRTRSGTNNFHGAVTWNIRNSALNANSWSNNRQGITPVWYNRHQYTASLGGPIIRNKTFFFALFDGQDGQQRENVNTLVLTDTARQGIFRFFPGVNNGHAETTVSGSGNSRVAPVVDLAGVPLDWSRIPGATGPLQSFNVFGDAVNPGDPNRRQLDRTGFIARLIQNMPRANAFNGPTTGGTLGDGLNTAVHRWVRRTIAGAAGGNGQNIDAYRRKQFNIKIDHHFNQNHRLSGTWIRESHYSDNNLVQFWPTGWGGEIAEYPKVMTAQLTSTLTPTLLNEFRWARRLTTLYWDPSYHHHTHGEEAMDFLTKINGYPVHQRPVMFTSHMINNDGGINGDLGNTSPLTTYTNTLSWTRGNHALKFGGEFRYASTTGWSAGGLMPTITGGAGDVPVRGIDTITGLLPPNITLAQNLLLFLSGSVQSISQKFETREPTDKQFVDFAGSYYHPDNPRRTYGKIISLHQNEFNFFLKDDWRVTPTLTLNLGVRYDLFRVPFFESVTGKNWTRGPLGGNNAVFGYSGRSIDSWMSGGGPQKGDLTELVLIGRDTPYPKQGIWHSDRNNWGPAIGFAWSPTWWGADKTTIRGGYQIAYQLPGNSLSWIGSDVGSNPGQTYQPTDLGRGTYRDFSNVVLPLPNDSMPTSVFPITERSQDLGIFAPEYTTPYVQNFTLGVTRSLASNVTLDVKYVGTRGVKLHSSIDINDADFRNNGLLQALEVTRAGGDAPMFDQMLRGLNIGSGVVGTAISGSEALRRHASFRTPIANGDYLAVARLLNTTNIGTVQPAGQIISGGTLRSSGLFPENFFVVNPQFSTITYRNNSDSSNYHSLQTQVTLRPMHGITFQGTYTWSRTLAAIGALGAAGNFSGVYRDLLNRRADYGLQTTHRLHDVRSFGSFELPFGPGKILGGNSSGWVARLIEGWQLGTIFNMNSGAPLDVGGGRTGYASPGTPDITGAFPREGAVVWPQQSGGAFGNFFGQQYQRISDPACANVASGLRVWCTITALADSNGNIVLQNARPGQLGTLGLKSIHGPGAWDFDANIQKSIRIAESKNLTLRVDAQNVFNHPTAGNPNLNINSGTFGEIASKTGSRTLQAQIRFTF